MSMRTMPSRQVHLDFHTSGDIAGIGKNFDKKQFQAALKAGHINSMTVFGKCHHGYHYFPTKVGTLHPGLTPGRDFSGEMMDACHEIGVFAPLYLTLGWSALDAIEHPEWIARDRKGAYMGGNFDFLAGPDDPKPECSWVHLCSAGGYRQYLYDMTKEACERYERLDGIFFDIVFVYDVCYCDSCVKGMKEMGLDPAKESDAKKYYQIQKKVTIDGLNAIIKSYHPDATIFYNSGGAEMDKPQWHYANTHFEMEDLPTVWGGYDKMPIRARYFSGLGKDYLGMTGKFHRAWGEFGGYKTPEALKYEVASLMSNGARVSIGDQLHPDGHMDMETYKNIGQAYAYGEQIEEYCFGTTETARLGVLVSEDKVVNMLLPKLLLDSHLDFDVVHAPNELEKFDTVLLPDGLRLNEAWGQAFDNYAQQGGKVILLGGSGLKEDKDEFAFNTGFTYEGRSEYDKDFIQVDIENVPTSPILCYSSAHKVSGGQKLSCVRNPYFSRTYGHYCSHYNTPYSEEEVAYPAAALSGQVLYIAHEMAHLYGEYGNVYHRRYFQWLVRQVYTRPAAEADLPAQGRLHMVKKDDQYILHLLYGSPIRRGGVDVMEDFPTIRDIPVTIRVPEKIQKVCQIPQNVEIPFEQGEGEICFKFPELTIHQMVVIS